MWWRLSFKFYRRTFCWNFNGCTCSYSLSIFEVVLNEILKFLKIQSTESGWGNFLPFPFSHSCIANRIFLLYKLAHASTHISIERRKTFSLKLLLKCQNWWKRRDEKVSRHFSDAISNEKHVLRTKMASKVLQWKKKSVMHIGLKNFHANIECHFFSRSTSYQEE